MYALKLKKLKLRQIEMHMKINKYGIMVENDDGRMLPATMADVVR